MLSLQKILLEHEPTPQNFLPAVKKINEVFGCISQENLYLIANYFSFSPAEAFSAISFYEDIRVRPKSDIEIKVCLGAPCALRGGKEVLKEIESFLKVKADRDKTAKLEVLSGSCQGRCQRGPVIDINGIIYEQLKPRLVDDILSPYFEK